MMNCAELDRWLDEGSPPEFHLEAMAHARICARCAASLRAMDELEDALATVAAAPDGFTERVMERVAATAPARFRIPVAEVLPLFQTFPWWIRVGLEPASLLAMLLAGILAVRGDRVFALAAGGAAQLGAWLAQALPSAGPGPVTATVDPSSGAFLQPIVLTCIALASAPLLLMGSRLLYDWSATLAGPRRLRAQSR